MADDPDAGPSHIAREADYRFARIGVAIGLTIAVIALLLTRDAVDAITLGFLLTMIGALLSVEGLNLWRGKP